MRLGRCGISVDVNEDNAARWRCTGSYSGYFAARSTQDMILLVHVRVSSSVHGNPTDPSFSTLRHMRRSAITRRRTS
jgi:hypothetical protein